MMLRHSVVLTCAAALSGALTAALVRVSQDLSLRDPLVATVEATPGAGHAWWMAASGFLLLIGAIAASYSKNPPSAASVGATAALLLIAPLLVFTSDFLATWVSLSAALAGFYLASCRITVSLRNRKGTAVLLWVLLAVGFATAIVGVLWAVLFLE